MFRKTILGLCLLFAASAAAAAPVAGEGAVAQKVDRVVARALAENRIVGAVVVVARDGKVLYSKASGRADREGNRPMAEDAVFRLASMTKPIVSAAVLRLVDQGVVRLDDPVTRWLPEFRPRTADGGVPVITIRHLLTHTAGLNYSFTEAKDGPYHRLGVSDGLDDRGLTLDENLARISRAPLLFAPGSSWHYSLAIDVLGRVLEKATGLDLATAVKQLVTGPLGMKDTEFVASHPECLATPYADGSPVPVRMGAFHQIPYGLSTVDFSPSRALNRTAYPSGGAGMVGTAADYLRFLEAIRKGGAPILKPETDGLVFARSTGDAYIPIGEPGWGWGMLSAILIDPGAAGSPANKGTIGWGGVYGSSWWIDRSAGLTVIILTNTAIEGMSGRLTKDVWQAVYDGLR